MIAELGHCSLLLALGMCVALAIIPSVGIVQQHPQCTHVSQSLATSLLLVADFGFFCIAYPFCRDAFSVHFVALTSYSPLPFP